MNSNTGNGADTVHTERSAAGAESKCVSRWLRAPFDSATLRAAPLRVNGAVLVVVFSLFSACDLLGNGDGKIIVPVQPGTGGGEEMPMAGGPGGGDQMPTGDARLELALSASATVASVGQEFTLDVKVSNTGGF